MNRFLSALLFGITLASSLGGAIPPIEKIENSVAQTPPPAHLSQSAPIDFSTLRSLLQAQNWQAADVETRRILAPWIPLDGPPFSTPIASNIPPEVLQTLDRLWSAASSGRFGYSVQRRIWEEVRSQYPSNTIDAVRVFGDRVGWRRPVPDGTNFVSSEWLTEPELKGNSDAPIGHFPWVGVEWASIQSMLNVQSCGSCMIDTMDLQGERFNRYIPVLFNWLATALEVPVPEPGSWQQARLAYSIDLRTLYASNLVDSSLNTVCPIHHQAEAISPDSTILAISSYSYERFCGGNPNPEQPGNSTLVLWNAQRGNRIITLLRGQAIESSIESSMDAGLDAGLPMEPRTEGNRRAGEMVGDIANAIAFLPDSRQIAAGLANGTIQLWTTDRGEKVRTLTGHQYAVRTIAISPDGQQLVSASADRTLKLWDLQTGRLLHTIPLDPQDGIVEALQISPDGQRLATATDRNLLQLWNAQTGQLIRTLTQPSDLSPELPILFSPDGQILATGDRDRSIKLWNAATGARSMTLNGHSEPVQQLAFSPDSQRLASTDAKQAWLWNLQTYQPLRSLDRVQSAGHPIMPNNLEQVAFSPDGRTIAASTLLLPLTESEPIPRQGITLWEVATGRAQTQLHNVTRFQFSPNGQFLMAIGQRVQIWQPYRSLVESE